MSQADDAVRNAAERVLIAAERVLIAYDANPDSWELEDRLTELAEALELPLDYVEPLRFDGHYEDI